MLAGFRSARNFTEWYAHISDFDCPGHAQSGFPQTAPGNGPERSRYFPRFVLTAEEGLFVYKMNRMLVALGVMDPATGNRKPKTPAAMRRLYEHPFHAALKGVKGYQARGDAAFAGRGGIPRAALDEGVAMHMFIGWLEGANDLGDFFRFEGTPRDDARLALLAARFFDDLSHSRHTPGKLALVQSIAEARPELLDDFRDVLQRAIEAGAEPSLPFTADFKSPFERDLFIDGKDPENEDRSKFFDFLVKNRDKIDEARDVLDVIDRGGDDRGGGRPNHRTTDSSDEDEDDESEDSWSDEEYTRARDGRRAARPSDPARTDLEKAREKQIRKRNRESARREAKRREEERKRLEREKRLAEKEAQKRAKKAADAERRRAAEAKSAEEKKRADDAVAELVAKRVRERLAKKQQQEDSRANWQQKKSPDGLAEAETVEKAAGRQKRGRTSSNAAVVGRRRVRGRRILLLVPFAPFRGGRPRAVRGGGRGGGGGGGPGGGGGGMCRELLPDLGDGFAEETDRVAELSRYVEVRCAAGCVVRAHVACYRAWVASRNDKEEGKKDGKEGKDGEGDTKAGGDEDTKAGGDEDTKAGASSVAASPAASSSSLCDVTDFPRGCACPSSAGGGSFCRASVVSAFRRHRGVASDVLASSVEAAAARRREEAEVKAKKAQEAEARKAREAERKAEADAERARIAAKKKAEADLARAEAKRTAEAARAAKRLEAEKAEAEARRQAELAAERRAEAERRRVEAREAEAAERAAARERELRIEREREARRREEKRANRARKLRETAEERRCEAVRVERSRRALAREGGRRGGVRGRRLPGGPGGAGSFAARRRPQGTRGGGPERASSSGGAKAGERRGGRPGFLEKRGLALDGALARRRRLTRRSCARVVRALSPMAQLYRARTVVFPTPAECASIGDEVERHAETRKFLDAFHGVGYLFEYERERAERNRNAAASRRGAAEAAAAPRGGSTIVGGDRSEGDEEEASSSDIPRRGGKGENNKSSSSDRASAATDAAFPDRQWPIVRVVRTATTSPPTRTKKKSKSSSTKKKGGGTTNTTSSSRRARGVARGFSRRGFGGSVRGGVSRGASVPPEPARGDRARARGHRGHRRRHRARRPRPGGRRRVRVGRAPRDPPSNRRARGSSRLRRERGGVLEEEGEGSSSRVSSSTPHRTDVARRSRSVPRDDRRGTPTGRRRRAAQRAKERARAREEEEARRADAREREERRRAEEAEREEAEREEAEREAAEREAASSRMSSAEREALSSREASSSRMSSRASSEASSRTSSAAPSSARAPPPLGALPRPASSPSPASRRRSPLRVPPPGVPEPGGRGAVVEPRAGRRRAVRQLPRRRPGAARGDVRAPLRLRDDLSPPSSSRGVAASGGRGAEDDPTRPPGVGAPADSRADRFGRRPVERVFGDPYVSAQWDASSRDASSNVPPTTRSPPGRRRSPTRRTTREDIRSSSVEGRSGTRPSSPPRPRRRRRPRRRAGARARGPPRRLPGGSPAAGTPPPPSTSRDSAASGGTRRSAGGGPPAAPRTPRRTPKQPSADLRVGFGPPSSSPFGSAGTAAGGDASSFGMPRTRAAMPTPFFHDAPPPGARASSSSSSRGDRGGTRVVPTPAAAARTAVRAARTGVARARHPLLSPHRNPLGPDPDAVDDDDLCPICCVAVLDETDRAFRPCTSASCAFVACLQCVKQMQETDDQKGKCPMCRGAYDEDEMRKLMGGGDDGGERERGGERRGGRHGGRRVRETRRKRDERRLEKGLRTV